MGFEYQYTCGDIDVEIRQCMENIHEMMVNAVDELCPLLSDDAKKEYVTAHIKLHQDYLERPFEAARQINMDMRKEADAQVDGLESEITELKNQIDDLSE